MPPEPAQRLRAYHRDGDAAASASPHLALSTASLDRFCAFITRELGIRASRSKLPMLQSRLQRRLRELGLPDLEAYQEFLFNAPAGEAERVHFIDAITTNKTDFFREPEHFELLARRVLPEWVQAGGGLPWNLRLWCAGCSSGEEPYTLAMVLAEFAAGQLDFDFSILATDVSTRVLEQARLAIYGAARIAPVPPLLRAKYLLRSKDPAKERVRIVPQLRDRVSFRQLNFMAESYGLGEPVHVVFFRNVLIYFDKPTQEAVINKIARHLLPGGYLFVGHSESLAGLDIPFQAVGAAVYRRAGGSGETS